LEKTDLLLADFLQVGRREERARRREQEQEQEVTTPLLDLGTRLTSYIRSTEVEVTKHRLAQTYTYRVMRQNVA
jgi:hypothetical protein